MILSNNVTEKFKTTNGTRTLANEEFARVFTDAPTRTKILNATVLFKTSDNRGIGSGVILNASPADDPTTAYVLTAKHLLGTLSGEDMKKKTPSECATTTFLSTLQLFYGPPGIEEAPPPGAPAAVSAVNFTGSTGEDWGYDIMVFESTTPAFVAYANTNRFVLSSQVPEYSNLLANKVKGCDILDKANYSFLQTGYGAGRDPEVLVTSSYEDKSGLFQCRWPTLPARAPLASAFEILKTPAAKGKFNYSVGSELSNLVAVNADNTTSTGPGDSGGPLFAVKKTDPRDFYLIGVTTGANYFTERKYRDNPASAPRDTTITNNVSTFWDTLFNEWEWYG